jgi:Transcription initiation factor IIB (TFIIB)
MAATTTVQACPECEGQLRSDDCETVCTRCGLVVDEHAIDPGPEWRSFEDDDTNPERTGAPLTRSRHDRGLSTEIGRSTRVKGRKRRQFARMRRQHKRSKVRSKAERNRIYAFTEIRQLVSTLDLPTHTRDRACVLFESAQEADLLRGRSIEGFAAAAVYATCRTDSVSRTLPEITEAAKATRDELDVAYDAMNRELGLPTGPIDPGSIWPALRANSTHPTVSSVGRANSPPWLARTASTPAATPGVSPPPACTPPHSGPNTNSPSRRPPTLPTLRR